jgi:copper resistance protein C
MRKRGKQTLLAAVLALLGLVSQPLWAHAHLVDQVPAEGEVAAQSPEHFELRFDAPIRITQFEVQGPEGTVELSERSLGKLAQDHRAVPVDALAPGEYRVVWRGLAEDGHTMSGNYRFSIRE